MEKIDRLGWAAGISFLTHGTRVGIRANKPELLEAFRPFLPYGWRPLPSNAVRLIYSLRGGGESRSGARLYHLVYSGASRIARTLDLEEAFGALETDLNRFIAETSWRYTFVHAGVVGWRGRALVLPGKTFTGKSTLVAELVRRGAAYYSDEFAVLDARGRVHPFPRPLSLRDSGRDRPRRSTAVALGGSEGRLPLPVGAIAFTEYELGRRWRPRALSAGRAVLTLMRNTINVRPQPQRTVAMLTNAARQARLLQGIRGEAGPAADALLGLLDAGG